MRAAARGKRGDKTAGVLVKRGGKGVKRAQKIRILKKECGKLHKKQKKELTTATRHDRMLSHNAIVCAFAIFPFYVVHYSTAMANMQALWYQVLTTEPSVSKTQNQKERL